MSGISIGTTQIVLGIGGEETGRKDVRCFDVGPFGIHETHDKSGKWTCSHKPSGFAVATGIRSVWDSIECAHAAIAAAAECGLDLTLGLPALTEHSGWQAFKKRGAEIRAAFNAPRHMEQP